MACLGLRETCFFFVNIQSFCVFSLFTGRPQHMATRKPVKCKLWSDKSMAAAMQSVQEGKGLREAARLNNVPVESLRRRVLGTVSVDCRPGPPTILTTEVEDRLCKYIIEMADIGFGLTREDINRLPHCGKNPPQTPFP